MPVLTPILRRCGGLLPVAAVAAGSLWLSGCVVAPVAPAPMVGEAGPVVEAPMAPPMPIQETVTVAPAVGYVWINGFWQWGGGRYAWRPGYWAVPPRPGYAWTPHRWVQGPGGNWRFHGGHWAPR
ncbi:YXWGXW repeat-containing protein [Variovorax terrae]|uniref:YXWGXW repeat-containing protein n=1 Tax=Variovorax terrae TaxID=2923278 RepID=A0A9X1VRE8_9BURK|nr:YXWGXW repeat-containing protein [Variovorax terrae]MCJ0761952.1 YXWGXW repeat-containing protein [Variovorax terrae]